VYPACPKREPLLRAKTSKPKGRDFPSKAFRGVRNSAKSSFGVSERQGTRIGRRRRRFERGPPPGKRAAVSGGSPQVAGVVVVNHAWGDRTEEGDSRVVLGASGPEPVLGGGDGAGWCFTPPPSPGRRGWLLDPGGSLPILERAPVDSFARLFPG
jgi:hypothetical protein